MSVHVLHAILGYSRISFEDDESNNKHVVGRLCAW